MKIKLTQFSGIAPAVSPRLLNENFAQEAENIDFESGIVAPITANAEVGGFTLQDELRTSIYKYKDTHWLEWEDDVDVAKGPIANDTHSRLYWTGDGDYPKMGTQITMIAGSSGYPAASYRLGIPAPEDAPGTTVNGTADPDQVPNSVSYIYTLVSAYGEEGPPSDPSTPVDLTDTETVTLSMPALDVPSGNYNFGAGALKRIYRSNTGSSSTEFQYVGEVAISATSFEDTLAADELGEVIPSGFWVGPPDDNSSLYPDGPMLGLISLANGSLAGFAGKQLCLSEPFLPHAWPVAYRKTVEDTIVAICGTNNGVVCLTDGRPVFVAGVDPSAMSATKVELAQACVNKHSAVDMGEYVLYAGVDGLCSVSGASGEVVTRQTISREQWNTDFHPDIIRAFNYKGTYVAFWVTESDYGGWVLDPRDGSTSLSTITGAEINGGWVNPKDGELYLIIADKINQYRGSATKLTATWKSKRFTLPYPMHFGWVQVKAESYPISVKVYADGTKIADYTLAESAGVYTQTITTPSGKSAATLAEPIMRLPAVRATTWEFDVSTAASIYEVVLAETMDELRQE
jgi:hypothetical protein